MKLIIVCAFFVLNSFQISAQQKDHIATPEELSNRYWQKSKNGRVAGALLLSAGLIITYAGIQKAANNFWKRCFNFLYRLKSMK